MTVQNRINYLNMPLNRIEETIELLKYNFVKSIGWHQSFIKERISLEQVDGFVQINTTIVDIQRITTEDATMFEENARVSLSMANNIKYLKHFLHGFIVGDEITNQAIEDKGIEKLLLESKANKNYKNQDNTHLMKS